MSETPEKHPTPEADALAADFRTAFRQHPAGVTIIAAAGERGPIGVTASSTASVSITPPTLLFSLIGASHSAQGILAAGRLSVNMLTADHADLAQIFATSRTERFAAGQEWRTLDDGTPVLETASASLVCTIAETVEVGQSVVVVATVESVALGEEGSGLVHRDRAFYTLEASARLP